MESCFPIWTYSAFISCLCTKSLSEPKIWEQNNDTKRIVTKEVEGSLTTTEAEQLKQMKSSHFESYLQIKSNSNNYWPYYYVIHPEFRILWHLYMDANYFSE